MNLSMLLMWDKTSGDSPICVGWCWQTTMRGRTVPLMLVGFYHAEVLVFIFLPDFDNLVLTVRLQFWVPVETSVETPPHGNTFHLSLLVIIPPPFWMKKLLIPSVPFRLLHSSPPTCEVRPPLACSSTVSLCDWRQRLCGNFILSGTKTMGVSCLEHDWRRILTIQELLFHDTLNSVCLFLFGTFLIEVVCGDRTGWQPHHFFCTLTGRMLHIIGWHTENIF